MNLDEAIAVFDKSAERTRPNKQTEAWTVIRAAIALMRGQSWQLIETAPVGEDILVYRHGAITPYRVAMLCRGGDDEFWVDAAEKRLHVLPTRWQPLPAPPKEPADEQ